MGRKIEENGKTFVCDKRFSFVVILTLLCSQLLQ